MRLLLINPRLPESFWSFSWAFRHVITDKKSVLTPLGLATLAALTPRHWDVQIIDENVEPIDYSTDADLVGVCGMAVQYPRQREILNHFRKQGCHVVAGGSYASLCPEKYQDIADTVVAGEAEYIWPTFCADFEKRQQQPLYHETGTVSLEDSPTPRYDLLKLHLYQTASLQFSRGCPFRCEFCDIIVTFGRKPRTKTLAQVERELDVLREASARNLFFIDDNLIGHIPRCKELLRFLADYQRRHHNPFTFGAETSANVASHPELLSGLRNAGFSWVFVGIESPSRDALMETKKEQNTRADLLESLQRIYAHGLDVYGSFVIGFDADDPSVFERQHDFIMESGIIVASIALLIALPKTPLHARLTKEGRLKTLPDDAHHLWDNLISTNIVPTQMTSEALSAGFRDLLRRISDDASIARRIENKLRHLDSPLVYRPSSAKTMRYLWRFLRVALTRGGPSRWRLFARTLRPALRNPRLLPFVVVNWVYGIAIQNFVREHLEKVWGTARSDSDRKSPTSGILP